MKSEAVPEGRGAGERILATAVDLFAKSGFNGVSIRDIAMAAKVNEVTIFRHFPRKLDLYLAALQAGLQRIHLRGDLLSGIAEARNGEEALTKAFASILEALKGKEDVVRLVQFGSLELAEYSDPLVRQHLLELVEVISEYLGRGAKSGELRSGSNKDAVLTLIAITIVQRPLERLFKGKGCGLDSMFQTSLDLYSPAKNGAHANVPGSR
jgi:AcrR family transcriptional regulator